MSTIADLELFTRTAAAGTLTQAAREMEMTPAAASAGLKRLEKKLGVRLFVRSTRRMRLTSEGDLFLTYCKRALSTLEEGIALLGEHQDQVRGSVRLSVPSDFGRQWVMPWLRGFQSDYPDVEITLLLTDRVSDFYRDAVDLAVRYGELQDSSLIAAPLCENQRVVCASPDYLELRGEPRKLQDLPNHNCLTFFLEQGAHDKWCFLQGSQQFEIKVGGDRCSDDGSVVRQWAVDGAGIAYKSWVDVAQDIEAGRLLHLLSNYSGERAPLYLVYPYRRYMAPAVRMLIEYIRQRAQLLPKLQRPS
ncbi:MAG: LysR family transcriptional regulator [Candidatus Sedimenticola sp. 20ELBAFRAG]